MSFDILDAEVNKGLSGKNKGIPMGFDRLTNYVGIRKGMVVTLVQVRHHSLMMHLFLILLIGPFLKKDRPQELK